MRQAARLADKSVVWPQEGGKMSQHVGL